VLFGIDLTLLETVLELVCCESLHGRSLHVHWSDTVLEVKVGYPCTLSHQLVLLLSLDLLLKVYSPSLDLIVYHLLS